MKDLIDKLSSYNLFNYLLPGIIFSVLMESVTEYTLIQDDIVVGVFLYYFIGLVISRIGSVILEPMLKMCRFVKFSKYQDYVDASKSDELLITLSEANNMYRTFLSLFICLFIILIYEKIVGTYEFLAKNSLIFIVIGLLVLFAFSYRKQTNYITKRVTNFKNKE